MNMPPRLNPRIAPSNAALNMVLREDPDGSTVQGRSTELGRTVPIQTTTWL